MAENEQPEWTYKPADAETQTEPPAHKEKPINWTASEYIHNHKSPRWFATFFLGLALCVAITFLLTRDYISSVAIAIVGILFVLAAKRQPQQLPYEINNRGVNIGRRFYPFESFKSFALASDGAIGYVNLMPLKRFMPEVSIFYPPEQEKAILELLSLHLPHDQQDDRLVDRAMKKIGF